jgi:hypothetical protein
LSSALEGPPVYTGISAGSSYLERAIATTEAAMTSVMELAALVGAAVEKSQEVEEKINLVIGTSMSSGHVAIAAGRMRGFRRTVEGSLTWYVTEVQEALAILQEVLTS